MGCGGVDVDADEADARMVKTRARAGRKMLKPRTDAEDEIRGFGDPAGGARAGNADASEQKLSRPRRSLASESLCDRNSERIAKIAKGGLSLGIAHAAPRDHHGALGLAQKREGGRDIAVGRRAPWNSPRSVVEERRWIGKGVALQIMGKRNGDRPSLSG